ncbi:MAG TPA: hypothetical protein VMT85_05425 [Thermoanaerobaculia bacterium]|nr:hypothetical protein [Thermoanaerobaculia bacterium]
MKIARPRRLPLLVAAALVALFATELSAQGTRYRVVLENGNEIYSKYKPVEASYDANKMILMTDQSNVISIPKDDILEMVAEVEALGFGRRLNDTTVIVGSSANDNPTEEQMQQMQQSFDAMFPGLPLNYRSGMPQTPSPPIFSEPGEIGRGIPVGFVTGSQPSLGTFPVSPQPPP